MFKEEVGQECDATTYTDSYRRSRTKVQPEPEVILQRRMKKITNHAATEVLVMGIA